MPKVSLEEQAAEADRLHREAYPELYKDDQESNEQEEENTETAPEQEAEAAPQVEETPAPPVTETEDWKQKYSVLKGKYDAEVPRLMYEVGELKRQIADLTVAKKETPKTTTPESEDDDPAIRYLKDEYPDVYTAIIKLNERKGGAVNGKELEERINRIEASQVHTVEDKFVNDLSRLAPEWDSINKDPRFVAWLNVEDPLTGYTRFQLASAAQNNLDGVRVAAFYNEFKKSVETSDTTVTETATKTNNKMEKFVAPPKTSSAAPTTKQKEDTITKDYITKFYDDAAKGRYQGRMDEFHRVEAKINKALVEGKITD